MKGNTKHVLEFKKERKKETYLCLSKHNINVRCGAFEHVWSVDNKQDAFGLPDGDSGHTMNWLQTQFRHGLRTHNSKVRKKKKKKKVITN